MNTIITGVGRALVFAVFFAASSIAQDQDDEKLKKDLTAVIALDGQPCGEVIAVKVQGDSDYLASCKDGNKYRVYLNAEGRVVVEKQK
jgi:hypothetical protein